MATSGKERERAERIRRAMNKDTESGGHRGTEAQRQRQRERERDTGRGVLLWNRDSIRRQREAGFMRRRRRATDNGSLMHLSL